MVATLDGEGRREKQCRRPRECTTSNVNRFDARVRELRRDSDPAMRLIRDRIALLSRPSPCDVFKVLPSVSPFAHWKWVGEY